MPLLHLPVQSGSTKILKRMNRGHTLEEYLEIIEKLKKKGVKIISIEQADKSLKIEKFNPKSDSKYAFIFGNEVDGVDDDIINVSDQVVEIPQVGTKHSLNVSVAAGIVLWDFFLKTEI